MFELLDRDAGGRICKWNIDKYSIRTPNIAIVINPNRLLITPKELKEKFHAELIITNSFIIKQNEKIREHILNDKLHKYLEWDSPVYTDSGTFQMFSQGIKDINQEEIINFQKNIGSNIITPVDLFTFPDDKKPVAAKKLAETLKRIKEAKLVKEDRYIVGPIQGGSFLDLREKAAKEVSKIGPDVFAIGGIVPLMEQYRFKELCDIVLTCKKNVSTATPIHTFGAGHPMIFSLLVAFGVDLFDSAMYSLAAQRDAYLTVNGTHQLFDLDYFPCNCPVCSKYTPQQLKEMDKNSRMKLLAEHNLYVTFSEINTIRQAIKEDSLWELAQQRARAHPAILEAFQYGLKKYGKYLTTIDNVSKKSAFFYGGEESKYRPEVVRSQEWMKRVKSKKKILKQPFGKIPVELAGVYPFGQSIVPDFNDKFKRAKPEEIVKKTIEYQYGQTPKFKFTARLSRKTGRIRTVESAGKLIGTIRASDGFFLPTVEGAKLIKMKKVWIEKDAAEFVRQGHSAFAKFVEKTDDILPGEEVAVYHKKELLGVGRTFFNKQEMKDFERGIGVKLRSKSNDQT